MELSQEVNGYEKEAKETLDGEEKVTYVKEHSRTKSTQVDWARTGPSTSGYIVRAVTTDKPPGAARGAGRSARDKFLVRSKESAKESAVRWMRENPEGVPIEENNSQGTLSGSGMFGDPFGVGGQDGQRRNGNDPFNWFM